MRDEGAVLVQTFGVHLDYAQCDKPRQESEHIVNRRAIRPTWRHAKAPYPPTGWYGAFASVRVCGRVR